MPTNLIADMPTNLIADMPTNLIADMPTFGCISGLVSSMETASNQSLKNSIKIFVIVAENLLYLLKHLLKSYLT